MDKYDELCERLMGMPSVMAMRDAAAAIRELKARLEIDPRHSIDGIAARDETIRMLEEELARLKAPVEGEIALVLHTLRNMGRPLTGPEQMILRVIESLSVMLAESNAGKDAAYLERNKLVALLSAIFPSGIKRTAIEGWSDDWHGCVYIDFPWGQASWHYHDSHAHLFAHLPAYQGAWDGHTTEQKYAAIVDASKHFESAERKLAEREKDLSAMKVDKIWHEARAEKAEAELARLREHADDMALYAENPKLGTADGYMVAVDAYRAAYPKE